MTILILKLLIWEIIPSYFVWGDLGGGQGLFGEEGPDQLQKRTSLDLVSEGYTVDQELLSIYHGAAYPGLEPSGQI